RNKITDQLLDTLINMRKGASWSVAVPNGSYSVKVSVGDAQYACTNTINVNGTNYWASLPLGANQFAKQTRTVNVPGGKITLDNGAAADIATHIDYIEITPLTNSPPPPPPPTTGSVKINFQQDGSPLVAG